MESLTLQQQFAIAALVCAFVAGAAIKHWRDSHREAPALSHLVSATRPVTPAASP